MLQETDLWCSCGNFTLCIQMFWMFWYISVHIFDVACCKHWFLFHIANVFSWLFLIWECLMENLHDVRTRNAVLSRQSCLACHLSLTSPSMIMVQRFPFSRGINGETKLHMRIQGLPVFSQKERNRGLSKDSTRLTDGKTKTRRTGVLSRFPHTCFHRCMPSRQVSNFCHYLLT